MFVFLFFITYRQPASLNQCTSNTKKASESYKAALTPPCNCQPPALQPLRAFQRALNRSGLLSPTTAAERPPLHLYVHHGSPSKLKQLSTDPRPARLPPPAIKFWRTGNLQRKPSGGEKSWRKRKSAKHTASAPHRAGHNCIQNHRNTFKHFDSQTSAPDPYGTQRNTPPTHTQRH